MKGKIHAFCGFDTDDPALKSQLQQDSKALEEWVQGLIPAERLAQAPLKTVTGAQFSKAKLMEFCQNVASTSDDVLFVFLGCHGEMSAPDKHTVILRKEKIDRSEILNALKKRPHKLIVLLTDACAKLPQAVQEQKSSDETPPVNWKECVCKSLFLDATGVVDINAASPNQLAWGEEKTGGVFTSQFMEVAERKIKDLDKNNDGKISWKTEFFPALVAATKTKYQDLRKRTMARAGFDPIANDVDNDIKKQTEQAPHAFSELPDIVATAQTSTVQQVPSTSTPTATATTAPAQSVKTPSTSGAGSLSTSPSSVPVVYSSPSGSYPASSTIIYSNGTGSYYSSTPVVYSNTVSSYSSSTPVVYTTSGTVYYSSTPTAYTTSGTVYYSSAPVVYSNGASYYSSSPVIYSNGTNSGYVTSSVPYTEIRYISGR